MTDTYGYGFESGYLVSNFDLIVVNLDARGTCCRGEIKVSIIIEYILYACGCIGNIR